MGPNKEFVVGGPWILLLRHLVQPGFGGAASASPLILMMMTAQLPGHAPGLGSIYPPRWRKHSTVC